MRISSCVRDMWVYHSSSCRSYCIQILLACYPPVHLGHRASQLLRILTLVMPEAALQTTPTYPSGSGEPENRGPPSAAVPGGKRDRQTLITLANPSRRLYPLQPKARLTHAPPPILPSPVYT